MALIGPSFERRSKRGREVSNDDTAIQAMTIPASPYVSASIKSYHWRLCWSLLIIAHALPPPLLPLIVRIFNSSTYSRMKIMTLAVAGKTERPLNTSTRE